MTQSDRAENTCGCRQLQMEARKTAVWLVLAIVLSVQGDFVLKVRVLRYRNSSRGGISLPVGTCCDSAPSCPSTDPCDNLFMFCLRPLHLLEASGLDSCPLGMLHTLLTGGDDEVFLRGTTAFLGLSNPLTFTAGTAWPGSVQLLVVVTDEDQEGEDLIDRFLVNVSVAVGDRETAPTFYSGEGGYGEIQLSFQVNCAENCYGPDCSVFCLARNDAHGHYTCDSQGNRVCLEGFANLDIDCTCIPAEGCSAVGGFCNVSGECSCHEGYAGDNCDINITASERGSSTSPGVIAGGVVAALSLIILAAVVGSALVRRRKTSRRLKMSSRTISVSGEPAHTELFTPGENPTYGGNVDPETVTATNEQTSDTSHRYEYVSSKPPLPRDNGDETSGGTYAYCYVGNNGTGQLLSSRASVHHETMSNSCMHEEIEVDAQSSDLISGDSSEH